MAEEGASSLPLQHLTTCKFRISLMPLASKKLMRMFESCKKGIYAITLQDNDIK